MTWPGNSQLEVLMLCISKPSHQIPAVILLLPIDKQCTVCSNPLRNANTCTGEGERRVWQVIHVLSFIFFLQAPKVGFFFAFLILCCCFIFMVVSMQCRFWLIKVWHLLLVIPSSSPLCFHVASFTWPSNCSSVLKQGNFTLYLKLECLDTDVFRCVSPLWKNFFFCTPLVQYRVSSVFGKSFAHEHFVLSCKCLPQENRRQLLPGIWSPFIIQRIWD